MIFFRSRMDEIQAPLIPVIGELISQHPGTISLGQGVVYYRPPSEAIANIADFWQQSDNHKYKSVQGIPPLLEAITTKLRQDNQIEINDDNCVFVTAGGNMAFINAIFAITQPGDEIILQTPYYFNHEMAIKMANCQPVFVDTDEQYQLCPDAIKKAITHKTKAVVTISPNNPTGVVYPETTLREVNHICQENGIYHISDEAYEYFTYDGVKHFSPASILGSSQHTISLFSLSKTYGFAGWRIGYQIIPKQLLMPVKKVQDTILICPPVISQYAAIGALKAGISYCQKHLPTIAQMRQLFQEELGKINHLVSCGDSKGAFYFFLKVHGDYDSFELAKKLITDYGVAVIPGNTFGMENGCYLRVAYGALTQDTAKEGIKRLINGLKEISTQKVSK